MFTLAYDEDGDLSDSSDQTEYHFVKRLPSEIVRNTYYKVSCNVSGTSPISPSISLNVLEWDMGDENSFDEDITLNQL